MVAFVPTLVGFAGLGTNGASPPGTNEPAAVQPTSCDIESRPKIIMAAAAGILLGVVGYQLWLSRRH